MNTKDRISLSFNYKISLSLSLHYPPLFLCKRKKDSSGFRVADLNHYCCPETIIEQYYNVMPNENSLAHLAQLNT